MIIQQKVYIIYKEKVCNKNANKFFGKNMSKKMLMHHLIMTRKVIIRFLLYFGVHIIIFIQLIVYHEENRYNLS